MISSVPKRIVLLLFVLAGTAVLFLATYYKQAFFETILKPKISPETVTKKAIHSEYRPLADTTPRTITIFDIELGPSSWTTTTVNSTCHCKRTGSLEVLATADAVILNTWKLGYGTRTNWSRAYNVTTFVDAIETHRKPHQVYVFYAQEPARTLYTYDERYSSMHRLHSQQLFNATSTYRLDSTYPVPYYTVQKRRKQINVTFPNDLFTSKNRSVVFLSSNCGRPIRNRLAEELAKHIQVDMFGTCWEKPPQVCNSRHNAQCLPYLERTYYFYLSMENSLCRDYSTEKLIYPLTHTMVPIVIKRSISEHIGVPSKAFIAFDDFDSIEEMAQYLQKVASNRTLYKSYFDWKQNFQISGFSGTSLCQDLHAGKTYKTVNISEWFFNRYGAQPECIDYDLPVSLPDRVTSEVGFKEVWKLLKQNKDSL